jgi:hypothetical protein
MVVSHQSRLGDLHVRYQPVPTRRQRPASLEDGLGVQGLGPRLKAYRPNEGLAGGSLRRRRADVAGGNNVVMALYA